MKKIAALLVFSLFISSSVGATYIPLTAEEQDGSPSAVKTKKIKVTNGTLTDNGGGIISIDTTTSVPANSLDFDKFQDTLDLDAALILNQTTNTWTQSFTGTTTTGFTYNANSITDAPGAALNITSTATAMTGQLQKIGLFDNTSLNTGSLLLIADTGAANTTTPFKVTAAGAGTQVATLIQNTGAGTSFRVNDAAGDTTPFLIDASGNTAIGTTTPVSLFNVGTGGSLFQVNSSGNVVKVNNITYSWPSSQGVANTVLTNNGSGTLTWGSGASANSLDFVDFQDTLDLDAALILNQTTNTWTQNFTGTTTTGFTYNADSLTSGKALNITSTATAMTGQLQRIILGGTAAANTGNLLLIADTGAANTTTPFKVTATGGGTQVAALIENTGTGTSFRVNDSAGDTTPFIIDSAGNVGIGTTAPSTPLHVFAAGGATATAETITINAVSASVTAADTFIRFFSNIDGTAGSITGTATSGLIAYNTFTGSHYTKIDDRTGLEPNILLEATGEKFDPAQGHLVKARICSKRKSKAAYGVYGGTNGEGKDMVLSVGTGLIWVANKGENIQAKDFLMSSDVRGCAEKQDGDIYYNYTVAKAMEAIQWQEGEAKRLIACIYLGG